MTNRNFLPDLLEAMTFDFFAYSRVTFASDFHLRHPYFFRKNENLPIGSILTFLHKGSPDELRNGLGLKLRISDWGGDSNRFDEEIALDDI